MWEGRDLNPRRGALQAPALPTELPSQMCDISELPTWIYTYSSCFQECLRPSSSFLPPVAYHKPDSSGGWDSNPRPRLPKSYRKYVAGWFFYKNPSIRALTNWATSRFISCGHRWVSNPRLPDCQSGALPAELLAQNWVVLSRTQDWGIITDSTIRFFDIGKRQRRGRDSNPRLRSWQDNWKTCCEIL